MIRLPGWLLVLALGPIATGAAIAQIPGCEGQARAFTRTDAARTDLRSGCPCWSLEDVSRLVSAEHGAGLRGFTCAENANYAASGRLQKLAESVVRSERSDARIFRTASTHACTYRHGRIVRSVTTLTWDEVLACHDLQHLALIRACGDLPSPAGGDAACAVVWEMIAAEEGIDGYGRPGPWPDWGSTRPPGSVSTEPSIR